MPDLGARRGNEAAGLGEHGDQRGLAQEGRLAAHVGPGDQPQPVVAARARRSLATNRSPAAVSALSTTGWRPPSISRHGCVGQLRAAPAAFRGARGVTGGDVDPGDGVGGGGDRAARRRPRARSAPRHARLRRPARGRRPRPPGVASSWRSGELKRTTPASVWRWVKPQSGAISRVGMPRRDLDMIAEHGVVADLERGDAGRVAVARFERGDRPAAVGRGGAQARRARRHSLRRYSRPWTHRAAARRPARAPAGRPAHRARRAAAAALSSNAGRSGSAVQLGLERRGGRQPVAQQGEVARAAAPAPPAAPARGRSRASPSARAHALAAERHRRGTIAPAPAAPRSRARSVSGAEMSSASSRRPARGQAAVDLAEQAAGDAARRRAGQLEALAGRGVDRHMARRGQSGAARRAGCRRPSGSRRDRRAARPAAASSARDGEPNPSSVATPKRALERALAGQAVEPALACRWWHIPGPVRRRSSRPATAAPVRRPARPVRRRSARTARSKCRRRRSPIRRRPGRPPPASWPLPLRATPPRSACRASPAGRSRGRPAPSTPRALRASAGLSVCSAMATRWPAADQPREIGFGRMDRHAAHRDRLAVVRAALGQRDVEALRRRPWHRRRTVRRNRPCGRTARHRRPRP